LNRQGQDQRIFEELTRFLDKRKASGTFPDQLMLEIGKFFLETAYGVGTLETKGAERLVVNLREFDCFTFVENVVAVAGCLKSWQKSFEAFRRVLKKTRYRNGRMQGYASRLHYFSDWIHDNQRKGLLRDVTSKIGGTPFRKTINFMTTHPDLYSALKDVVNLKRLKSVERAISRRSMFFISKEGLRHSEDRIHDGDIIAITANTEGLDVQHVGLAVRVKNRIYLLHASSTECKVRLSKKTLYRYLMQSRARSGMIVARLA
jgi:hypothetical protein